MSQLSFILPTHDPDMILFPKVLKALVTQSLKDWEAIWVMDGSYPEAVKAIHAAFKKTPIHYKIVEMAHGGAQKARNEGLKHANGDYVVFFDSDCVIEPHAAQAWVDILDKNPSVGFVYSGYRFLDEKGAITSEPFDPWMLRVRNYISACFPVRRTLVQTNVQADGSYKPWNESLKSLQDWDFWLGVVERGGVGKFLVGNAFSTAYPTPKSISGQGCTPDKWLERMDAVKSLHNIPIKDVCVTSMYHRLDGIAIAKAIGADYDDHPNDKPNHYKTIMQIGFSIMPEEFERCASVWGKQHKKVLFWTADDVEAIYNKTSMKALEEYSKKINMIATQYVEDKRASEIMTRAGFRVSVLPLPVISTENVAPLPEKPKFMIDIAENYGHAFMAIQKSIPDIELELAGGVQKIEDYTGLISFHPDRMLRPSMKRMLAAGRQVVSNVQQPFCGYMNDHSSDCKFVVDFVEKIREAVKKPQSNEQVKYYIDPKRVSKLAEAIR